MQDTFIDRLWREERVRRGGASAWGTDLAPVDVPVQALVPPAINPFPVEHPYHYLHGTYPNVKTVCGKVMVHVDKAYRDEVTLAGGHKLFIDTEANPLQHVVECGRVVVLPSSPAPWHPVEVEAQVGDLVYFHFHAINDHSRVELEGRTFYLVDYDMLYCAVREGLGIVMLNDFCLVLPLFDGSGAARTASGIILHADEQERPSAERGILRHAPPHRPHQSKLPAVGSTVAFLRDADLPLAVEGEKFYIMDGQREIICSLL